MNIRKMKDTDIAAVSRIEKLTHIQPWSENVLTDCYHSDYLCLVAEENDYQKELKGYIILSQVLDEAHLLNLCVSLKYQGFGLGRELTARGIKEVFKRGARKMFLEVRRSNMRAIRLYESFGFSEIGIRTNYYQGSSLSEDAVVMALVLPVN
jgi:ribosomal-protein-alanine N-acetyltransferase